MDNYDKKLSNELWDSLIKNGQLTTANQVGIKLISFYLDMKYYSGLEQFFKKFEKAFPQDFEFKILYSIFLMKMAKLDELDVFIANNFNKNEILEVSNKLLTRKFPDTWKQSAFLMAFKSVMYYQQSQFLEGNRAIYELVVIHFDKSYIEKIYEYLSFFFPLQKLELTKNKYKNSPVFDFFLQEQGNETNDSDILNKGRIDFGLDLDSSKSELHSEVLVPVTAPTRLECKDIIVSFLVMELHISAMKFMEKYCSNFQDIDFDYYRLLILQKNKRYAEAISLIETIVFTTPIEEDEKTCFYYIYGEVFEEMGDIKRSKEIFELVYKKNPNYRLIANKVSIIV